MVCCYMSSQYSNQLSYILATITSMTTTTTIAIDYVKVEAITSLWGGEGRGDPREVLFVPVTFLCYILCVIYSI